MVKIVKLFVIVTNFCILEDENFIQFHKFVYEYILKSLKENTKYFMNPSV